MKQEKETIPLVRHVITDEDAGTQQELKLKPMNLDRATKLLTDPHSLHMIERHINALHRIAEKYSNGFLMKDIVQICEILDICADRLLENERYAEPLCELLQVCRQPFLKERMSDEVKYKQIAVESLSQLGYLMRVPSSHVRMLLTDVLRCINSSRRVKTSMNMEGLKGVDEKFNRKMIELSDLSETLVTTMPLLTTNLAVRVNVLKLIKELSTSPANCRQIVACEGAYIICSTMTSHDTLSAAKSHESELMLFVSVEILWNLLSNESAKASVQLCNMECISIIKNKFRELMTSSTSNYRRQLRNDLLVITTLVVAHQPNAPIIESGFAKDLILFATFTEIKSHNPLVRNLQMTQCHEDFELKRLFINFLVVLSKDPAATMLYSESKVLLSLFHFVKANSNEPATREWSPAQFEELQLHSMSALISLSILLVDDYMACQGNIRLLLLLEWCTSQSDEYRGEGNSFHGPGSRDSKKAQMKYTLRLLRALVFTNNFVLIQDLCDQGVMSQLLQILENYPESNEVIDIEIQFDLLHILSAICENDVHRKELFGNQGVEVLVKYMKRYTEKSNNGLGHHRILLATVDAISCCVIGCFNTEDLFLELEGIFLLLDLLEASSHSMNNLTLGCLLELTENPKSSSHLHTWRGKGGELTTGHLMAQLWRSEEKLLGVERTESHSVCDLQHPLAGTLQRHQAVVPQPSSSPSLSVVDVSENLRAKIYCMFLKLGFSDLPGLTTDDYVTLAIIEKYLDLKLGEIWTEVACELPKQNIRPTTPDQEALETIQHAVEERTRGVALLQRELLDAEKQQNFLDEKDVYVQLKSVNRQFENSKIRWMNKLTRTSNYRKLCFNKRAQLMSIQSSRTKPSKRALSNHTLSTVDTVQFHDTMIKNLQTTTFQGRHIQIEEERNNSS